MQQPPLVKQWRTAHCYLHISCDFETRLDVLAMVVTDSAKSWLWMQPMKKLRGLNRIKCPTI